MTEKQCTLVDMYSEQTGRSTKLYSDYQDADGNHYKLKSSTKDYVGSVVEFALKALVVMVLAPKLGYFGVCIVEPII